jgi:predicted RNase H-like HicB family nuclease
MTEPHYHINLSWSEEDRHWVADVPDLPFCSAHGVSAEEAARQVQSAIAQWLKVATEDGDPVPQPRYKPAVPNRAA